MSESRSNSGGDGCGMIILLVVIVVWLWSIKSVLTELKEEAQIQTIQLKRIADKK